MPTARFVGSHPLRPERPALDCWKMWHPVQWSIFFRTNEP